MLDRFDVDRPGRHAPEDPRSSGHVACPFNHSSRVLLQMTFAGEQAPQAIRQTLVKRPPVQDDQLRRGRSRSRHGTHLFNMLLPSPVAITTPASPLPPPGFVLSFSRSRSPLTRTNKRGNAHRLSPSQARSPPRILARAKHLDDEPHAVVFGLVDECLVMLPRT